MPRTTLVAVLPRHWLRATLRYTLPGIAALLLCTPARAQFLYGITNLGGIYEVNVSAKTTTLAFTTNLSYMNGLAFYEGGDQGSGQVFYRAGTSGTNGSTGFYVWNRRTNGQALIAVPNALSASGYLPGSSSNASWYNGAYWYVQQGMDTLTKVTVDLTNLDNPVVSSIVNYTNFDGTSKTNFSFGDISISSSGILYGSTSDNFFQVNVSSAIPTGYSETTKASNSAQLQLQVGFGADGTTLYGEAAGSGAWYTVDKTNGTPTSLNFTSNQAFNDISEGSVRSVTAVAQPEPASLALLLPLASLGLLRKIKR